MNEYTITLATLMDHLLDITIDVANGNVGAVAAKSEALVDMARRLEQSARRWQHETNGQEANDACR